MDLHHLVHELDIEEHDRRIGIVEDVEQLFFEVAVINVHMRQAAFEAGGETFHVFRLVAQVEAGLVADLCAAGQQVARHPVGPGRHVGPGNAAIAMDQRHVLRPQRGADRIQDIAKVPEIELGHGFPPSSAPGQGAAGLRASLPGQIAGRSYQ